MSSTDDRIVRMQFDNAQFKKGAAETQKSLADVNKAVDSAGKSKGLLDLNANMQRVSVGASKMAIITTTAIATITNKAVNAGISMAKSLTFDPIRDGFQEYESLLTKQNVIMNATGKSAETVKKVLGELNTYSDETIYSFGNMTDAIQKFVNAGVPLKTSVTTIKGIANAAAFAGASSEEANRAMYAFSQSMSLGFIQLQDWNQIENANMGTIRFKNELLKAGAAAGTLTKKGKGYVTASGKFVSATEGWRDGLQEQWATTEVLNKALGKYADQNTKLGKKAFEAATQVRTFTAFMDTLKESIGSGWAGVFTALIGNLDEATAMWTGLSQAVGGVVDTFFKWATTTLTTWRNLGGFEKTLQGFKNLLAPIGALLGAIGSAWRAAFPDSGAGSGKALYGISAGFAAITSPLQLLANLITKLTPVLTIFFSLVKMGASGIGYLAGYVGDLVSSLVSMVNLDFSSAGGIVSFMQSIVDGLANLFQIGVDAAGKLFDGFISGFQNGSFDTVANIAGAGILGAIALMVRKIMKNGLNFDLTGGLLDNINDSFSALTGSLKAMQTQIQAKTLMEIAISIALITASVTALSFINTDDLTKSLTALSVGFGQLLLSMAILVKISGHAGFVKIPLIAASMVLLSTSILILVAAIAAMSALSWEQIGRGLAGVGGALVIIAGAMHLMPKTLPITAAGLVLVGVGLTAVSAALKVMGSMSWEEIGRGLASTAGALLIIAGAMYLMPMSLPITAAGLVLVAIALNGIGAALKVMGSMSWEEIGRGLVALGGSLAILAIGLSLMSASLTGSAALLIAAAAIAVLTPSLLVFSKMSWEEIAKGLVGLAGGLAILAIALYAMYGAIPGAIALLIVSPAILALAAALKVLSSLSWEQLAIALVALAGGLAVIGLAGLLIAPVVIPLLALGAALLLLGAGLALAGAGTFLFATGLTLLVGLGAGAISYLTKYIQAFIKILPELGKGFGMLIVEFVKAIAKNSPVLIASFVKMLGTLIDSAEKLLPKIGNLFEKALDLTLKIMRKAVPDMVSAGINVVVAVINGISSKLGAVVAAGTNLIINWIKGITKAYAKIAVAAADAVIEFIHSMADAIRKKGPELGNAMGDLGVAMVQGLISGIASMFSSALGKIGELASGMVNKAKGILKIFSPSRVFKSIGKFLVMGLTEGIQKNAASAIVAVASMVGGQIAVANEYISKFIQKLDQQAIAAQAKASGLALAAQKAQKSAEKTKSKADDKSANKLAKDADKAQKVADKKLDKAEKAKAKQDKREEYRNASTLDKAKMRSEDAQNQLDAAKAAEARAQKALTAANALDKQAKSKGVSAKERKKLEKQADDLRAQAKKDAKTANTQLANSRRSAAAALALQKKAGAEAAALYDKQFKAEAKAAADEAKFEKMTDAEKAVQRRKDAEALNKKAQKDLAAAKKLAYTDLEAANELAAQAMDEAEQARQYIDDAKSYEEAAKSSGGSAGGTVVNLDPTEAASVAFNRYSDLYDSSTASAAGESKIEFNQYNTSPEALSPSEVYRNTNNQLTFAADKLANAA